MINKHYQSPFNPRNFLNFWDLALFALLFASMALLAWGSKQLLSPYSLGAPLSVDLDPKKLPYYLACTSLRMIIALLFSIIFSLSIGKLAASSKKAERFLIPLIDLLQSIPVLGFLSFSVLGFVYLFPGSLLGPQCAAIFAIFTAQVWNMILSFYSSLKLVPKELKEMFAMAQLSSWRSFWQLEVPFAIPALIWNTMMSMSASWFFVVASEALFINKQEIQLPGIGSYIAQAIHAADNRALAYALLGMFFVILIYDQLLFRPLLAWSEKFKLSLESDNNDNNTDEKAWLLTILHRSRFAKLFWEHTLFLREAWLNLFSNTRSLALNKKITKFKHERHIALMVKLILFIFLLKLLHLFYTELYSWMLKELSIKELLNVVFLGAITLFKVVVLLVLASIFWVPIGVFIGLRPGLTRLTQGLIQFLAAFPANLLYPFFTIGIIKFSLNPEVWTAPLMILGTQWYLLFNVIAGTRVIPKELKLAAENYQLKGFVWWRRFIIPAIFPYYVTGSISAAAGCWNACIIAEVITWGDQRLEATGLGRYIVEATEQGDFLRLGLGIGVMCIYVLLINRLIWQKLYRYAQEHYHYD